jgi:hypothetical protein
MRSYAFPSGCKSFRRTTKLSFTISSIGICWRKAFNISILNPMGLDCLEKWKGANGLTKKCSTEC